VKTIAETPFGRQNSRMGPPQIRRAENGASGAWVIFSPGLEPVFVADHHWVGVDLDGTLSSDDNEGHFEPPYPLGQPIPKMVEMVKSLISAGIRVKIFSARASDPENIPIVQEWAERHGLGRLEVTNQKDYDLIRFFDDRAIQVVPNQGLSVSRAASDASASSEMAQRPHHPC
jgi:hypothetical protein